MDSLSLQRPNDRVELLCCIFFSFTLALTNITWCWKIISALSTNVHMKTALVAFWGWIDYIKKTSFLLKIFTWIDCNISTFTYRYFTYGGLDSVWADFSWTPALLLTLDIGRSLTASLIISGSVTLNIHSLFFFIENAQI